MLNCSASLAMSTSILKALPGKLDIKSHSPSILYVFFRKLKQAKEKLKHLQSLVAMVQQAPDTAGDLPDNLAEIAASMEDESQVTQPDDRNNASLSEGEVPGAQAQR